MLDTADAFPNETVGDIGLGEHHVFSEVSSIRNGGNDSQKMTIDPDEGREHNKSQVLLGGHAMLLNEENQYTDLKFKKNLQPGGISRQITKDLDKIRGKFSGKVSKAPSQNQTSLTGGSH